MSLTLRSLVSDEMSPWLGQLAGLRVAVFRAFPYLYDGDLAYEEQYLRDYAKDPNAVLVGAFDGDRLIGAATGMPLASHSDAADLILPQDGPQIGDIYYCAESVLLPEYRGRGLGHAFFDHREAIAREGGFAVAGFVGVMRPADHPLRPEGYQPLDPFWRKRGYERVEGSTVQMSWKDIGEAEETQKTLQFWMRRL
ncbi:MAG: GNAT family N-acetyltransferase [Mangrovicoccus sp.]